MYRRDGSKKRHRRQPHPEADKIRLGLDWAVSTLFIFHRHQLSVSTYELGHEGNHEVEKTDGLDESETQNGVREELATESRVAGNAVEEGGEDETDTDTGTSQTNGGSAHTNVLGDFDHGLGDLGGVGTTLDGEGLAGGGIDDGRHLLALDGLEGRGLRGGCVVKSR